MDKTDRGDTFAIFVGLELKGSITSHGRNASDVATKIGRSPAAFNRWLNGRKMLPLAVLCEAAEEIGIDPQEIVGHAYDHMVNLFGERDGARYELSAGERREVRSILARLQQLHGRASKISPMFRAAPAASEDEQDERAAFNPGYPPEAEDEQ